MKLYQKLLGILAAFSLIIILLISSVEFVVYALPGFFQREYTKYQIPESMNMEMSDLLYVTDEMMDYLRGKRENLHIDTNVNGLPREFFNEKEISHMEDVRDLFLKGLQIRMIAIIITVLSLLILVFTKANLKKILPRSVLYANGLFLGILAIAFIYIARDFTKAFIQFHEILFSNNLWILDPSTDLLINLVPEPFFIDTALSIGITFGISMVILSIISACYARRNKL